MLAPLRSTYWALGLFLLPALLWLSGSKCSPLTVKQYSRYRKRLPNATKFAESTRTAGLAPTNTAGYSSPH